MIDTYALPDEQRSFWTRLVQCLGIKQEPSIYPDDDIGSPTKDNGKMKTVAICSLCIEPNALKRKCCNGLYCDHCWTKTGKCPHCGSQTKQEAKTGATFQVKVFSEHEECRVCLDPGTLRRCCNNYYCDDCYYKVPNCRSCGEEVGKLKGKTWGIDFTSASFLHSLLGWFITIFVLAVAFIFSAIIITVEVEKPISIFNYKAYGFFKTCDRTICWDMDDSVASGDAPIPAQNDWTFCDVNSTTKLRSKAFVFDAQLYQLSDRQLGIDVCIDDFSEGVYIFDDNFETWDTEFYDSVQMRSARWANVVNGKSNNYCGAAPREDSGSPSGPKHYSLSFAGELERKAETEDMDVSSGGRLEAELYFPPLGSDTFQPLCKTGFQGTVELDYSIDGGSTWVNINTYDPQFLRSSKFFHIKNEIPEAARTTSTRFRYRQPFFEGQRDHFALDDVRVLRYLPKNWHTNGRFKKSRDRTIKWIQRAQCCVDSDWCRSRFDQETAQEVCKDFAWYQGYTRHTIRMVELFILCTAALNIMKFIYVSIQDYLMRERFPFQDEIKELLLLDSVKKRLPVQFRSASINADDEANRVHISARMEQNVRDQLDEGVGEGGLNKREDELKKERKAIEREERKKKRRLEERMKKKNYKGNEAAEYGVASSGKVLSFEMLNNPNSSRADGDIDAMDNDDDALEMQMSASDVSAAEFQSSLKGGAGRGGGGGRGGMSGGMSGSIPLSPLPANSDEAKFGVEEVATDLDKVRRQNMALLRVPFIVDWDPYMCQWFAACALFAFSFMFLLEMSVNTTAYIHQYVHVYGSYDGDFVCSTFMIVMLAAYCDLKEIFYTIKYVIPCREKWVPMVTIDLAEDAKSLYVGGSIVPLAQIYETQAFTMEFTYLVFGAYCLAVFPYTLFIMVLRDMTLNYGENRVVVPFFGSIILLRALLGPGVFIKLSYLIKLLLDVSHSTREKIGRAFGTQMARDGALTAIAIFLFLTLLLTTILAIEWTGVMVAAAIFSGAVYGSISAVIHQLPVRPWMLVTTLKRGVWMHLRKKQRCPCYYWGNYLTALHNWDEVAFVHTTDEVKFMSVIKGGVGNGNF